MASLGVGLKRFDLAGREVTLGRVEVTGLDARIRRAKTGDLDIVTIAKGLGAGYQPIGAMLCSAEIYGAVERGSGFF